MVFLVELGFTQQTEVARAFARSVRTVRRHQRRYAQGGMAALGREVGWRRGRRRISGKRLRNIEMLKSQGLSNRAIARRLGVCANAIRKLVGPSKPAVLAQLAFAGIASAPAGKPPATGFRSATASGDDADRATPPAENSASDRDLIAAPVEEEPVAMSLDRDLRKSPTIRGIHIRSRVNLSRCLHARARGAVRSERPACGEKEMPRAIEILDATVRPGRRGGC